MSQAEQSFEAGVFHPDLGNEVIAGKIFLDPRLMRFRSETTLVEIPIARLSVELGRKAEGRIYFFDSDRPQIRVFTSDESILNHRALTQSAHFRSRLEKIVSRREVSRRILVTLYFFIAVAVFAWLGSLAMGAAVHSLVNEIPASWKAEFGSNVIHELQERVVFINDSNKVAQLAALAAPLTRAIGGATNVQFHIVADSFPNAFALPGGHVVVNSGLLKMADTPEQLLGVIAHEMVHVTQKHGFRKLISAAGPILTLQILFGSHSTMLNILTRRSGALIYGSFSQKFEKEADDLGWDYLVKANIDPRGMIEMFQKLKKFETKSKITDEHSAFSDHPALDKRIAWLEAKWERLPKKSGFIKFTNRVPRLTQSEEEEALRKSLERLPGRRRH
ncbi:MAG TPA: M48 family metallopeptidase [Verrucomicrobiae bacterium]|nr:M48 family metallopeptidase [Verrucomicrobiae bacterium]